MKKINILYFNYIFSVCVRTSDFCSFILILYIFNGHCAIYEFNKCLLFLYTCVVYLNVCLKLREISLYDLLNLIYEKKINNYFLKKIIQKLQNLFDNIYILLKHVKYLFNHVNNLPMFYCTFNN